MPPQKVLLPYNRAPKPGEQRFHALQPYDTHYGWVSCKDYDCEQFLKGWKLILPAGGEDVEWVRSLRNRKQQVSVDGQGRAVLHSYWFTERQLEQGLIEFTFPAGQPCFQASKHRWHVRPPLFAHERGETRRNLGFVDFTDLMNEESYKITRAREKG